MPPTVFIKDGMMITSPGGAADSTRERGLGRGGILDRQGLLPLLLLTLLGAAVFAGLGLLALRLTIEPGFHACPVWPAAGWSVLLTLRYGGRALPGVILGSLATELGQGALSGADLMAPSFLGCTAGAILANTLRVLTGWALIRRWARTASNDPAGPELLPALLCAMLAGGVGGVVGASLLTWTGAPQSSWLAIAWTWASGDAIGTLVVWPLLVPLLWAERWPLRRRLALLLPMLLAVLGVIGFYAVTRTAAEATQRDRCHREAEALADALQRRIDLDCETLVSLEAFFHSSQQVDAGEFATFTGQVLGERRTVQALNWIRRVPGSEREGYEQAQRRAGWPGFTIRRQLADGRRPPALAAEEHRVVAFTAPHAPNAVVHGLDLLQIPRPIPYYDESERIGAPLTSPPIRLLQETGAQQGCVVVRPVWLHGANRESPVYAILASGRYPRIVDAHCCSNVVGAGTVGFNAGHIFGVDGTDPDSVSAALIEGRRMAEDWRQALAEVHPAFARAHLVATGAQVGIRETRRIRGGYVLTLADWLDRRSFADEIGRNCYFLDVHWASAAMARDPAGFGRWDTSCLRYGEGESHGIPYRCLTPAGLRNVLVAGRSVSAERIVQGSIRVMPACLVMGEAAGLAAALAASAAEPDVHAVDTAELRRRLRAEGAFLP